MAVLKWQNHIIEKVYRV